MMRMVFGRVAGAAGLGLAMLLTGCNGFFVDPNTTTTTTAGSTTSDYLYTINSANTLSEFVVGTATLTAVSGSPLTLPTGLAASSIAVTRANSFVYVGGAGAIECYSIGSTGALTQVTSGGATETANFISLDTSPDGQWLFALDNVSTTIPKLYVFGINTSTGALSLDTNPTLITISGTGTVAARSVHVSSAGSFVGVALGGGGDDVYAFNTTTGVLTLANGGTTSPISGYTDDDIAFNEAETYGWIARGGPSSGQSQIVPFQIGTGGVINVLNSAITAGNVPYALRLNSTGAYLYAANRGDSTVSAYTVGATGGLTAISGSPFASGDAVSALAEDNGAAYLIAAAVGGTPDLTMYSFDATTAGKLDSSTTANNGTGTAGTIALATTH